MAWRALRAQLAGVGYIAGEALAMALHLALTLGRPLLLEGEAGVGKTDVAQALAAAQGRRLIRLQCYEGLDAAAAIYEWNYQRQLLAIRARRRVAEPPTAVEGRIFSEAYLLSRPLLEAILPEEPRRSSSSTRSTERTRSSRPTCSRSWPTSRSPSPSSARIAAAPARTSS